MKWFGGDVNRESNWRTAAVNKDNKTLALHIRRSRRRYSLEAYMKRSVSQDKIEEVVVWFGLGGNRKGAVSIDFSGYHHQVTSLSHEISMASSMCSLQ